MSTERKKAYLFLHILLAVYSVSGVFSKLAGGAEFPSFSFVFYYGCEILLLGIYAVFWQQIIKRMPITEAYANRAVTVFWGFIYGCLFFHETVSVQKIIGLILITAGIILFSGEESSL